MDDLKCRRRTKAKLTPQMVQALNSIDATIRLDATSQIRKLLSAVVNPPIDEIIKSGIVPQIVHFLEDTRYPELHFESTWILTNVVSGNSEQTQVVIEAGAIPVLIQLLTTSSNADVIEQAVWALGNISADSPQTRDIVLNNNLVPPLLELFNDNISASMMRLATWTLSNLCMGKDPPPNFKKVSQSLTMLSHLIFNQDTEVLTNVCMALSFLSDGPNEQIQAVVNSGVCRRAVKLLSNPSTDVVSGALRLLGNIVTGNTLQTQAVINANALPALGCLLSHEKEAIVWQACWTVSNITAGTLQQIQAVIDANLIPPLIELLASSSIGHRSVTVRREAAWAITNATNGSRQQIVFIVQAGAIPPLCQVLPDTDSDLIGVALTGLDRILQTGEETARAIGSTENEYATLVEQCGGLEKMNALSSNDDWVLKEKASLIMEKYFNAGNRIL